MNGMEYFNKSWYLGEALLCSEGFEFGTLGTKNKLKYRTGFFGSIRIITRTRLLKNWGGILRSNDLIQIFKLILSPFPRGRSLSRWVQGLTFFILTILGTPDFGICSPHQKMDANYGVSNMIGSPIEILIVAQSERTTEPSGERNIPFTSEEADTSQPSEEPTPMEIQMEVFQEELESEEPGEDPEPSPVKRKRPGAQITPEKKPTAVQRQVPTLPVESGSVLQPTEKIQKATPKKPPKAKEIKPPATRRIKKEKPRPKPTTKKRPTELPSPTSQDEPTKKTFGDGFGKGKRRSGFLGTTVGDRF